MIGIGSPMTRTPNTAQNVPITLPPPATKHNSHSCSIVSFCFFTGYGIQVTVAHSGHCDEGPPVGVQHGSEAGLGVIVLEHVDQGGEHDSAYPEEEDQQPELLVV